MLAVLDAIDRTGHVGMTEPAASALAAFRAFNFERIYLRPAARRQAERVVRLLARPRRPLRRRTAPAYPDAAATLRYPAGPDPRGRRAAVRYVSGMTDRFASASASSCWLAPRRPAPRRLSRQCRQSGRPGRP